jgi:hypothetical protein
MTEEQKKTHLNNLLFVVKKHVGTGEEIDAIRASFNAISEEVLKKENESNIDTTIPANV